MDCWEVDSIWEKDICDVPRIDVSRRRDRYFCPLPVVGRSDDELNLVILGIRVRVGRKMLRTNSCQIANFSPLGLESSPQRSRSYRAGLA